MFYDTVRQVRNSLDMDDSDTDADDDSDDGSMVGDIEAPIEKGSCVCLSTVTHVLHGLIRE